MKQSLLFILIVISLSTAGKGPPLADSLKGLLVAADSDSARIELRYQLVRQYCFRDPDTALLLVEEALNLARQSKYRPGEATGLAWIGFLSKLKGDFYGSLDYYGRALSLAQEIGDSLKISNYASSLGTILYDQARYPEALEYYYQSLRIAEKLKDTIHIAHAYGNIGIVFKKQGDFEEALNFYYRSLELDETQDDSTGMAVTMNNLAEIYRQQNETDSALLYHKRSLKIKERRSDHRSIAISLSNIGQIYSDISVLDTALQYHQRALSISESIGDKSGVASSLASIGHIKLELGLPVKVALGDLQRSLDMAKELGAPMILEVVAGELNRLYRKMGHWEKALEMYELYITMRDSSINEKNAKAAIKQQMAYEFEKKEALLKAAREKQALVHREKVKRQELTIWSVATGLLLVIIFSVFLYNRFKITQQQKNVITEQKREVDEKNRHITDSINYAQKIQEAILPSKETFDSVFGRGNHFILFKPKDVVSGDFYWIHETTDQKIIWAAADCTGHGVPGAFMSMIGTSLLNEIVIEKNISQSDRILNELRTGIKKALGHSTASDSHKDGVPSETSVKEALSSKTSVKEALSSETSVKDGMDIAICVLDRARHQLQYSGAYNPFYLIRETANLETEPTDRAWSKTIRDKNQLLLEMKADRQPIGIYISEQPFSQKIIPVQKGDRIYTFSDGFVDQFRGSGNPVATARVGKKFGAQRFRETLLAGSDRQMEDQHLLLEETFEAWKMEHDQIDDICILGVKI